VAKILRQTAARCIKAIGGRANFKEATS